MAVWVLGSFSRMGKNGKKYNKFGGLTSYATI
jgi:hypothetical protein